MAFRVFLSYSLDPSEQALAWRLQTLATAHGIEMYVPQRGGFAFPSRMRAMEGSVQNAIGRADCVLAIITAQASSNVQKELEFALAKKKLTIPIVSLDLVRHTSWLAQFPRVFTFSPWDPPGKLEGEIVAFLKEQKVSKEKQQTINALVALGVGLLLLFSLSEK